MSRRGEHFSSGVRLLQLLPLAQAFSVSTTDGSGAVGRVSRYTEALPAARAPLRPPDFARLLPLYAPAPAVNSIVPVTSRSGVPRFLEANLAQPEGKR